MRVENVLNLCAALALSGSWTAIMFVLFGEYNWNIARGRYWRYVSNTYVALKYIIRRRLKWCQKQRLSKYAW